MCSAVIHKLRSEFFITSFNSWLKIILLLQRGELRNFLLDDIKLICLNY